jgi:metal-sulfur cluster biosynthetic enzyme
MAASQGGAGCGEGEPPAVAAPAIVAGEGVERGEAERVGAGVLVALGGVRDPELDEPLPDLGFVEGVEVHAERVVVRLRLPTFFCAANFTYLMAADARDAAHAVAEGRSVAVTLDDHFVGEEVSEGVSDGRAFSETFDRLAEEDLDELRRHFRRKAHTVRQWTVASELSRRGWSHGALATARVRDAPAGGGTERLLALRAELGYDTGPDSPLVLGPDGRAMSAEGVSLALDLGRLTAVSMSANTTLCRGLLGVRYGLEEVRA